MSDRYLQMADSPGFGLYIHWPFCQAKCPYCDFNSHVSQSIDQTAWAEAFAKEIANARSATGPRQLKSIFLGGGTPSLMLPETVERVISGAQAAWNFANNIEITLEANPTSVEAQRFKDFRSAGVNRVSLGLQALNDADLKRLGRLHSAREGRDAFDIAQSVFDRASFDLIYARQDQSLANWEEELADALSFGASHMSLYQLTIEPGTAFADRFNAGKLPGLPSDDLGADLYFLTQAMMDDAGLPAYETSNHATAGQESQHNLIYWKSGDWVGIGPGAHGRLTIGGRRMSTEAVRSPGAWIKAVQNESATTTWTELQDHEISEETLMMGLRLSEGIRTAVSDQKVNDINRLSDSKLLEKNEGKLKLTKNGRPLLNAVLRELLA